MSATDTLLNAGSDAPNFTAQTTDGATVSLHDFRGRQSVLLMFYPKDDTPGCTKQMCTARDEGAEYAAAGVARFGVNDGGMASHQRFRDKYSLDFPLIIDAGGEIARAYGTLKENGGIARSTFLIDTHGRIVYAAPGAHGAEEVLEALRG